MKMIRTLPLFILLFVLLFLSFKVIYGGYISHDNSKLINKRIHKFSLDSILGDDEKLTDEDLTGKYTVLNIFASWCAGCVIEHADLMKLNEAGVAVYGIAWKDSEKVINWLNERGNPYREVGDDRDGKVAIGLGVSGAPETFLISMDGIVIYHHTGPLDQNSMNKIMSIAKQ